MGRLAVRLDELESGWEHLVKLGPRMTHPLPTIADYREQLRFRSSLNACHFRSSREYFIFAYNFPIRRIDPGN